MTWRHVTLAACAVAVLHHYLAGRIFQMDVNPPRLFQVVVSPPLDAPFFWYPLLTSLIVGLAVWRSSLRLIGATLIGIFVAGYLRLMWDIGSGPGEKVDPRWIYAALTAHAMGWASMACAIGAILVGIRNLAKRRGAPSQQ